MVDDDVYTSCVKIEIQHIHVMVVEETECNHITFILSTRLN